MKCLNCNQELFGRSDKKFCDDGCRNTYNNEKNRESSNFIRNVNRKLGKNHRLLKDLNYVDGRHQTTIPFLLEEGFDFSLFTGSKIYQSGEERRYIYDYNYLLLADGVVLISKDRT